jgi:hypothetical protein
MACVAKSSACCSACGWLAAADSVAEPHMEASTDPSSQWRTHFTYEPIQRQRYRIGGASRRRLNPSYYWLSSVSDVSCWIPNPSK